MGEDQPVYTLHMIGPNGEKPGRIPLESAARRYVELIREAQPTGPYYLAGSSGGGTVAYEMAQQLRAAGESVALLALLDTYGPGHREVRPGLRTLGFEFEQLGRRAGIHRYNLSIRSTRARLSYLADRARALARRLPREIAYLAGREHPERAEERWSTRAYTPQPYAGPLTLVRARDRRPGPSNDPTLGWAPLAAGGIEVLETPGTHGTMLVQPNAPVLARVLRDCVDRALTVADGQARAIRQASSHADGPVAR